MERELWSELSAAIFDMRRGFKTHARATHSIACFVRVYLWAILHDRPIVWACRSANWSTATRPQHLPSQSTMSRRTRTDTFQQCLDRLGQRLNGHASAMLVKCIDGKPLTVANHTRDPDAGLRPRRRWLGQRLQTAPDQRRSHPQQAEGNCCIIPLRERG
ncbi:MAG: hypothetical protein ACODAQ_00380 [Phycisphaeraceae bacterium]